MANNFLEKTIASVSHQLEQLGAKVTAETLKEISSVIGNLLNSHRWVCVFEPSPSFFIFDKGGSKDISERIFGGVDMDDALSSAPDAFRMLRAFESLSFIKLGDEENQALKDIVLKYNKEYLLSPDCGKYLSSHPSIMKNLTKSHALDVSPFFSESIENGQKHLDTTEMAIEAALLQSISRSNSVFGKWDYLTHQVIASPFKPIRWVDHIDVFGYRYIEGTTTKSEYLVIEIKKGEAKEGDAEQLMKYVDWVKEEYCHGDYSMIHAFLVASSFKIDKENLLPKIERNYLYRRRPADTRKWTNLELVKFFYADGEISFEKSLAI
jgi:hypothetical protein